MSAFDPEQALIPTSILGAAVPLPTACPWGPSRVGAPCCGAAAGDGSHGLAALSAENARGNPRLNPHPLKPGVYSLPSPLGEGLVWNGWIGGESGGLWLWAGHRSLVLMVTAGSSIRALWVNTLRSTEDTVIRPIWSGIHAGADPGVDTQKICRRRRV